MRRILSFAATLACFFLHSAAQAQLLTPEKAVYSHADSLRGSVGPERAWWNLLKYELQVTPDYAAKSLSGENAITFAALTDGQVLQIDLQEPMQMVSATWRKKPLAFTREGNVFHIRFPKTVKAGAVETVVFRYQGIPKVATRPPWGGRVDLDQGRARTPLDQRGR